MIIENPLNEYFIKWDHHHEIFQWDKFGVTSSYCLFFTPRSGSTLLKELLNQLKTLGNPDEYLSVTRIKNFKLKPFRERFTDYFAHVVKNNSQGGCFGIKIDPFTMDLISQYISITYFFGIGHTKSILLTRDDLIGQCFSLALGQISSVWHIYPNQVDIHTDKFKGRVSESMIWELMFYLLIQERRLNAFFMRNGISPLRITYEELNENRLKCLFEVISYLSPNFDITNKYLQNLNMNPIVKNDSKLHLGAIDEFNIKYSKLINLIMLNRYQIPITDLYRELKLDFGMEIKTLENFIKIYSKI